jgi:3-phenylpropionate/trans-cinnamate dioxygenase ferredoxin reductase subunit
MTKQYAIVGFGCAGYQALCALRESDSSAQIHVWSELAEPPANPMLTTYYAAGRLPYEGMFPFGTLEEISRRYDPVLHMSSRVVRLDAPSKTLVDERGQTHQYDGILLATGATPLVPPLGVETGRRVLCMRTVEDAKLLRARLEEGKYRSITVIGGSMVGIKIVELCVDAEMDCTLADMAPRIFPLAAFPDVSEEIQRRLVEKGVKLRFGSAVSSAQEDDDGVTTCFADGEPVRSDLLVLCIGTRARTELAREAGLEVNRGIVVDDSMQTSAPGIYAAGDCCEGKNIMTGGHQIIGLWANAAYQGQTAGHCMAGDPTLFSGNILHNITHFMGMDFVSFGDVNAQGTVHTIGTPGDTRYIEAVERDGQIQCINLLDSYHISGVVKNYLMNRFCGNQAPLPVALRGLLAREGFTDEFLALFEGGTTV